ncbi:cysteine-rich CWC family protein [Ammoniphilus sp. YIM 78166]|uniref:cysteine-rich CWC family protein n=1 Tax=Ammoniphilus sp. YIM 78166 TaxID=1644106 RepID=UPI0010704A7A|nr:cysteine-rich CWC family protein [Ammoniphilus sp. YIM 78166]
MIPENVCPLCGQENRCGNLAQTTAPCWCSKESFPQELLDSVPGEWVRKACICKRCLEEYKLRKTRVCE